MITPYRQTDIILDADSWVTIEPTFRICKFASKMFKKTQEYSKLIMWNKGLIVKPYNLESSQY